MVGTTVAIGTTVLGSSLALLAALIIIIIAAGCLAITMLMDIGSQGTTPANPFTYAC
jgi:hypothetical protein